LRAVQVVGGVRVGVGHGVGGAGWHGLGLTGRRGGWS
jgi:hypothetical protein